ncbi:MAG: hypothetical protein IPI87_12055 [Betaproteobacteria bacterium]|nr:hypothetical protein [Betaproteobacteria bacterium]
MELHPQGRVASRQQVSGSVTLTTGYAWTNGRLTGMTTPSGQQLVYSYADGKLSAVTLNGSPLVTSIGREPFGSVSVWQWGNGHKTFRDHDLDGRIANWEYRNGTSILRRDLTWDAASRVTGVADPASPSNSHSYGYDVLDRLTTALSASPSPTTRQYGYDAIGNRLNETADGALTNYGYGPDSHRLLNLTGATTRSYTYDGVGNPVTIDARTHTYNLANRLAKIAQGSATIATYKVNALGQRVAKTLGSTTTRYVYDEQGRLIGGTRRTGR